MGFVNKVSHPYAARYTTCQRGIGHPVLLHGGVSFNQKSPLKPKIFVHKAHVHCKCTKQQVKDKQDPAKLIQTS